MSNKHSTFIEQDNVETFKNSLLTLRNTFLNIKKKEENQKFSELKNSLNNLTRNVHYLKSCGGWRKTHFNLFEILGVQRREEPHSDIIAWLINPEETHGLGNVFLQEFIKKIFNLELPFDSQIKVFRESQKGGDRPDIIVEGNNWLLIIENKIDSSENNSQTLRYANRWRKTGGINKNVFLVYLSPDGRTPISPDFRPVSYRIIRELLERMQFQGDSEFLIRNFINHIFIDLEV